MKSIKSMVKIILIVLLLMLVVFSVVKLTEGFKDEPGGEQIIYVEDITVEPDQIIF